MFAALAGDLNRAMDVFAELQSTIRKQTRRSGFHTREEILRTYRSLYNTCLTSGICSVVSTSGFSWRIRMTLICRPFITLRNGKRLFAHEVGKTAFCFEVDEVRKAKQPEGAGEQGTLDLTDDSAPSKPH